MILYFMISNGAEQSLFEQVGSKKEKKKEIKEKDSKPASRRSSITSNIEETVPDPPFINK